MLIKGKKQYSKEMPFKSHQKREKQKNFTLKVFFLCLSLFSIILFEDNIVLNGKEYIKNSLKNKKKSSFVTIENIQVNTKLKREIRRDLARTHQIIHQKPIPKSHFQVTDPAEIEEDF